jgi:hypothetical protein
MPTDLTPLERELCEALELARAHIATVYSAIAAGNREAGRRFAETEPIYQHLVTTLAKVKDRTNG